MLSLLRVFTSESMIPRPCFQALNIIYIQFCYIFARSDIYFRLHLLLIIITTTCILLSLRRISAPIHLTSVLGVLGTQETFCIVIAVLLERDSFDLLLPEFDKPWVIHLRETCCCSTNLCTWRPNTIYKDRSVRRHHLSFYFYVESSSSIFVHQLREHSCHFQYNLHSPKMYYWLIHDYGIACSQIIYI
jgi:hypothetical protein